MFPKCNICGDYSGQMMLIDGLWYCSYHAEKKLPIGSNKRGFWKGNKGYRR